MTNQPCSQPPSNYDTDPPPPYVRDLPDGLQGFISISVVVAHIANELARLKQEGA